MLAGNGHVPIQRSLIKTIEQHVVLVSLLLTLNRYFTLLVVLRVEVTNS